MTTTAKYVPSASTPREFGVLRFAIAAIFGLFYAYDVWEAVGYIIYVPVEYAELGFTASVPWRGSASQ